jgi:hypothetical protein
MNVDELIGHNGTVISSQATYVVMAINGRNIRFDFIGKVEFRLEKDTSGICSILSEHPILIDHNEPWSETYINSIPSDPEIFIKDIREGITNITGGWRDWKKYVTKGTLFTFSNFRRNVLAGNGLLSHAPTSVMKVIVECCELHKVATYTFDGTYKPSVKKLLLVGQNFVVAEDFIEHYKSSAQQ